eukprot:11208253-Lingulodinium_polyedra.AAC.1
MSSSLEAEVATAHAPEVKERRGRLPDVLPVGGQRHARVVIDIRWTTPNRRTPRQPYTKLC